MYHQCPASWGFHIPREPSELYSHFEQHILNFDAKTENNIEICSKIAKNIVNVVNSCVFFPRDDYIFTLRVKENFINENVMRIQFLVSPTWFDSSFHLPRADHWNILLHTLGVNELGTLIKKSYSYARQCLIAPGDVVLFRPLQSSILAIEKYLFNPNSIFPQLINLILHIIIFALVNYLLFLWFNLIDAKDKIFKY